MGNWHLDFFPNNLLDWFGGGVKGVGGASNVEGVVDVVDAGDNNGVKVSLQAFVVACEAVCARCFNDSVCERDDLVLDRNVGGNIESNLEFSLLCLSLKS